MTLGQLQELFAELQAQWVLWVLSHPGWKLRMGEGRILARGADGVSGRKAREIKTGRFVYVEDLVHLTTGGHPKGIAVDWQLFVGGTWITNSSHPVWLACGEKWESMHPLCRWGGRFTRPDGNHISMVHNGIA